MQLLTRFLLALRRDHVDPRDDVRAFELSRRLKSRAIERDRSMHLCWRKVRGKGVGQPQGSGQVRSKQRRPQNVERNMSALPRDRAHPFDGTLRAQKSAQLLNILRKSGGSPRRTTKGSESARVSPWRSTQSQVDA